MITLREKGSGLDSTQETTLEHWVYDPAKDHLVADVTAEFPPGSILIGQTYVSSALEVLAFKTFDDRTMLGIDDPYSPAGSDGLPVRFNLCCQEDLIVNSLSDEILTNPFSVSYTTFGDNLTNDFTFIPNTAGVLRAVFALASDPTKIAFDEKRVVTQAEVDAGLPILFNVGNAYLLEQGVGLVATFSGIQLKGGTPTSGTFSGVQLPYYVSQVLHYIKEELPTVPYMEDYVDGRITQAMLYKGGYDASTNTPNLQISPTGVLVGWVYTVEVAGTFFSKSVSEGDTVIAEIDDPAVESDWTVINRHIDADTIKVLYESNTNTEVFETLEKSKLSNIEDGAEVNVQADWEQTSASEDSFIKNKPEVCWGAGYFDAVVTTPCEYPSTWYKINATFTPTKEDLIEFDNINKRWVFTGDSVDVGVYLTFIGGHGDQNTQYTSWEIRKNGSALIYPHKNPRIEAYDTMSITMMVPFITLVTGDYLELYCNISETTEDVYTSKLSFLIR